MLDNILLMTDSYKVSHYMQYPPGTTHVYSYLEARKGGEYPTVTFFGLSYILQRYLQGQVVTREKIEEAADLFRAHFGSEALFNREGWEYILNAHNGRLPVEIRAVAEGSVVPVGNALMTIVNTDPMVPWLVNYLETLLVQVWYPTTVCTQSWYMKKRIHAEMIETGADMAGLAFKLHDFGYRGSTSVESAGIGGAAHLVNFMGTDTIAALEVARAYYAHPIAGFSIPAAEHSTITAWGMDREKDAYENMLDKYPTGLVAVVSDSYNIFHAAEEVWGTELRDKVLGRDGVVVIRPDSGDPAYVLCRLLDILAKKFGSTLTSTGHKVLNPKVRLIQGDGIDARSLDVILAALTRSGWSTDNIAFGSGGGLLQKVNRDTCRFAMKCSAVKIDGEWRDVSKSPIGASWKASKSGRLELTRVAGQYVTVDADLGDENLLRPVFSHGTLLSRPTLSDIRMRAELGEGAYVNENDSNYSGGN